MCAGVVARKQSYLPYIKKALNADAVAKYFAHLLEEGSQVERSVETFGNGRKVRAYNHTGMTFRA